MTRTLTTAVLAAFLLCSGASHAQAQMCKDDDTVEVCWDRIIAGEEKTATPVAQKAATETEAEDTETLPTGADSEGSLATNTKSFLPLLAVSGLLGNGVQKGDNGELVIDLNFLVPGSAGKNSQLQAILGTEPELSDAAKSLLPTEGREDLVEKLGKGLDSADDLSISYSYSWLGLNRGRDFEQYRARYIHLLETAKPGTTDTTAKNLALGAFLDLAESCFPEDGAGPNDQMRFQEIEDSDLCGPVEKQRAQQLIAQAAQASRDELLEARAAIAEAGLLRFGELVANQPQLYLTAQLRKRDALIGGDERSAKFSYEWSMTNLAGSMSTSCHEKLNVGADQTCADAYKRYVADNEDSIAHGNRFSLSIEYIDVDESTIPFSTLLPDAGLADKTLDGARKNIWKLGWSRLFDTAPNLYRLDFVGSYEDVSDDPMRRDRLVATLSIERKVGKDWSIPLGIVYANHGQYLPEVDERLSAHVGLKFNVSDPDGN